MRIDKAIEKMERITESLPAKLLAAEKDNLATVMASMRHHSSGQDHSRHKKPVMPINEQSGQFLAAFRTEEPHQDGDAIVSSGWNDAPHAKYLQDGTKRPLHGQKYEDAEWYMEPRPLVETVIAETEKTIEKRREKAVNEAFRA